MPNEREEPSWSLSCLRHLWYLWPAIMCRRSLPPDCSSSRRRPFFFSSFLYRGGCLRYEKGTEVGIFLRLYPGTAYWGHAPVQIISILEGLRAHELHQPLCYQIAIISTLWNGQARWQAGETEGRDCKKGDPSAGRNGKKEKMPP